MISFRCPKCGGTIKARNESAGAVGRCACGAALHIPGNSDIAQSTKSESRSGYSWSVLTAGGVVSLLAVVTLMGVYFGTAAQRKTTSPPAGTEARSNQIRVKQGNPKWKEVRAFDDEMEFARFQKHPFSWNIPWELQFGCVRDSDREEEAFADTLAKGNSGAKAAAARSLWEGHSRRYAAEVLKLLEKRPADDETLAALHLDIEAALKPEAVLLEIRNGDYRWGAWLAYLRPHKDLVVDLRAAIGTKPDLQGETILALGSSRDSRALSPLLTLVKEVDKIEAGFAARALGDLGMTEAEKHLIEALDGGGWLMVNACNALGKIGTTRALPALEKLVDHPISGGWLNTYDPPMRACADIERRVKPRVPVIAVPPEPASVFRGHTAYIWNIAISPNGALIASAGDDQMVRIWDAATVANVTVLPGHARQMQYVQFTADSKAVATAGWGDDGTVRVVDIRTGKILSTYFPGTRTLTSLAVSPDGKLVAVGDADGNGGGDVVLWDVATGKTVATLAGAWWVLGFDHGGKLLATADPEDHFRAAIWDVKTRTKIANFGNHKNPIHTAAFSPDSQKLATGGDRTIRLWDVESRKEIANYRADSWVQSIAFSPDGKLLASSESYGPVRVWDVASGNILAEFKARGPVAFNPDGKTLATVAENDKDVVLWPTPNLR